MTWESIYNFFGIKDFIYFISSSQIQDMLFPAKLFFAFCSVFFLIAVIYFMMNSSWLQYKFLEDVTEFFSWKAQGQKEIQKQWARVIKRTDSGAEADYKLAIIDADDFLGEVLDEGGYDGEDFNETVKKAGRMIAPILDDVIRAHEVRNSIVYNPDFKIAVEDAKKVLATFESAIKGIGLQ